MENASKALIIAGAILISILIIAIGMYIYSSSTGSIDNAISSMDTQEVQAFNATWSNYEGTQSGTQVKSMITQLIGHAKTYEDEQEKVINIECSPKADGSNNVNTNYDPANANALSNYISSLNSLYSNIGAKHNYTVELDFEGTAIIRRIKIKY